MKPTHKAWVALGLCGILNLACTVQKYYPVQEPSNPQPVEHEEGNRDAEGDRVSHTPEELCSAISASREIPVGCQLTNLDGTPMMVVVANNAQTMDEYIRPITKELIVPYCQHQNRIGIRSGVILGVGTDRIRALNCASGELSPWQRVEPEHARALNFAEACQAVQESTLPISCALERVDDRPALVLGYRAGDGRAEHLLPELGRRVAQPYCNTAVQKGVDAFVVLVQAEGAESSLARTYNCHRETWTPWQRVRKVRPAPRRRQSPGQARAPVQLVRWEHLK